MLLSWNAPLSTINCNININPRKTKDPYLSVIPFDFEKTRYHSKCFSQYAPAVGINFHMILEVKLKTFFFEQFLSES